MNSSSNYVYIQIEVNCELELRGSIPAMEIGN
jgi:hypothetical protein